MHKQLHLLLFAAFFTYAHASFAVSSSSMPCKPQEESMHDLQEEYDNYQSWINFERSLENHPNARVHELVREIERDIWAVTQLMAQAMLKALEENTERMTIACSQSTQPFYELAHDLGALLCKVDAALQEELFVESDRDALQQGDIKTYFQYQKMILNQLQLMLHFCLVYSQDAAAVTEYTAAFDPSFRAAKSVMSSHEFYEMSDLSKDVCVSSFACIYEAIPSIYTRYFDTLRKSEQLIELTSCTNDQFLQFMDARMTFVGDVYKHLFYQYLQQNTLTFEGKLFDDLTQEEVIECIAFMHQLLVECTMLAEQQLTA